MNRRGFLAMVGGLLATRPTTTLMATGPEYPTTVVPAFVWGSADLSLHDFQKRYLAPAAKAWGDALDAQVASFAFFPPRAERMRVRFDSARLPQ